MVWRRRVQRASRYFCKVCVGFWVAEFAVGLLGKVSEIMTGGRRSTARSRLPRFGITLGKRLVRSRRWVAWLVLNFSSSFPLRGNTRSKASLVLGMAVSPGILSVAEVMEGTSEAD